MKRYVFVLCLVVSCFLNGCSGLQSNILDDYQKGYKLANFQRSELKEIDIEIKNIPWSYLTVSQASIITSALDERLQQALSSHFTVNKSSRYKLLVGYRGSIFSGSTYFGPFAGCVIWTLEIEALAYIIDKQNHTIVPLTENKIEVKDDDFSGIRRDFSGCVPLAADKLVDSVVDILASKYRFSK